MYLQRCENCRGNNWRLSSRWGIYEYWRCLDCGVTKEFYRPPTPEELKQRAIETLPSVIDEIADRLENDEVVE